MGAPPPGCCTYMSRLPSPPRSDAKASSLPSGERAGSVVRSESDVSRARLSIFAGTVARERVNHQAATARMIAAASAAAAKRGDRLMEKRAAAGDHLIENRAEAENVGTDVDFLPLGLLGRHVGDGSHDGAFFGTRAIFHGDRGGELVTHDLLGELGQAEVEHLDMALRGH